MALTKTDLNQIRTVVREEVDQRLENRLGPIENRLGAIDNRIGVIDNRIGVIEKDMKYLKKKVNKMNKTLDVVVKNYDEGDVKLHRRVLRIEQHLTLPKEN